MVWQVSRAVEIPVIGIGGITTVEDAIEFLLAQLYWFIILNMEQMKNSND